MTREAFRFIFNFLSVLSCVTLAYPEATFRVPANSPNFPAAAVVGRILLHTATGRARIRPPDKTVELKLTLIPLVHVMKGRTVRQAGASDEVPQADQPPDNR